MFIDLNFLKVSTTIQVQRQPAASLLPREKVNRAHLHCLQLHGFYPNFKIVEVYILHLFLYRQHPFLCIPKGPLGLDLPHLSLTSCLCKSSEMDTFRNTPFFRWGGDVHFTTLGSVSAFCIHVHLCSPELARIPEEAF